MTYAKRKAQKIRFELLAEGALKPGKPTDPFPVLKVKMDKAFSELIRLVCANDFGLCKCVTCPTIKFWKEMDCGHFVNRDELPTRWDVNNARSQCAPCNRFKTGRRYEFGKALNDESPGLADRLILKGKKNPEAIRAKAPEMFLEIKRLLKMQRARFK